MIDGVMICLTATAIFKPNRRNLVETLLQFESCGHTNWLLSSGTNVAYIWGGQEFEVNGH